MTPHTVPGKMSETRRCVYMKQMQDANSLIAHSTDFRQKLPAKALCAIPRTAIEPESTFSEDACNGSARHLSCVPDCA